MQLLEQTIQIYRFKHLLKFISIKPTALQDDGILNMLMQIIAAFQDDVHQNSTACKRFHFCFQRWLTHSKSPGDGGHT